MPRGCARVLTAAIVATTGLGACGGHSAPVAINRPLTANQDVQLASTLYLNYTSGGAHINARLSYSPTVTVGVAGDVDFRDHTGHLEVITATKGSASTTQDVDYTDSAVYESEPDLALPGGVAWTARDPDPTNRPLDRVIQLIVGLASPQRGNPLLVDQSQARFTGSRSFAAMTVNVYRYGPSISYWVGVSDGLLYRYVGTAPGIAGPVTIDLTQRGAHPTPPPDPSLVIAGG